MLTGELDQSILLARRLKSCKLHEISLRKAKIERVFPCSKIPRSKNKQIDKLRGPMLNKSDFGNENTLPTQKLCSYIRSTDKQYFIIVDDDAKEKKADGGYIFRLGP